MVFKCSKCDKEFNSSDALEQHQNIKHGRKQMLNYALLGVVVLLILVVGYFMLKGRGSETKNSEALPTNADDWFVLDADAMDNGAMHIHPYIQIIINGKTQTIPSNMGVSGSKMNVMHMHDASGTLHIESPVVKAFKLKHFFLTWSRWSGQEKVFNSTCIFNYCNTADKNVKFFVNDKENSEFENLVLKDLDKIRIEYS